jgi:hypothetical protein
MTVNYLPHRQRYSDGLGLASGLVGESALVTHNVKDFLSAAAKFGLRILRPGELLKEIRS